EERAEIQLPCRLAAQAPQRAIGATEPARKRLQQPAFPAAQRAVRLQDQLAAFLAALQHLEAEHARPSVPEMKRATLHLAAGPRLGIEHAIIIGDRREPLLE